MSDVPRREDHIGWLDGLRGVAAFWVFASHVQILSGMRSLPVVSWGALAVDLFMMLSGFLMARNFIERRRQEPWNSFSTIQCFWIRRFFRIAPVYYLMLAIALSIGPELGDFRQIIAERWIGTGTSPERYADQSLSNTFLHLSYAFGFLPKYAFRTALPDWSIGLEMQFYLLFPLIMLLIGRIGPIVAGLLFCAVSLMIVLLFRSFFAEFEMPAALPMKLYVFIIGIWIAFGRGDLLPAAIVSSVLVSLVLAMIEATPEAYARVVLIVALFLLVNQGKLASREGLLGLGVRKIQRVLSAGVARFLGDTSYAVYLVHLLVLIPVAGYLAGMEWYVSLASPLRFVMLLALVGPVSYLLSWLIFITIERRGILFGRALIARMRRTPRLST
jgi:peptidoglycan/LPS O-acetylase OafA/YrhL